MPEIVMQMQFRWLKIRNLLLLAMGLAFVALTQACRGASPVSGLGAKANEPQALQVSGFWSVFGTRYLMASGFVLTDSRKSYDSYSSYGGNSRDTFNYLFMNPDDLTTQWLLPHSDFLFLQLQQLPLWKNERAENKNPYQPQPPPKADEPPRPPTQLLIYTLVKANTNDNKTLDEGDRKTIAISDVSGSAYTELIQDVDSIIHQQMASPDEFLMVYLSHGKYTAMRLHLKTRQITLTKELAPIPKSQSPLS